MSDRKGRAVSPEDLSGWGGPAEMSAFEAAMWLAEADPRMRSIVTGVIMLDRAPDWPRLLDRLTRLTNAVPRLRQRVMEPAFGVGLPQWVDDPEFLIDFHLRRERAPEPGVDRAVLDIAQNLAMEPLDRLRPPWAVRLVEGLSHGRAALVLKIHHVLSDGLGFVQLLDHVVSSSREGHSALATPPARARRSVTPIGLAASNGAQYVRRAPAGMAGALASVLESVATLLRKPSAAQDAWGYFASAARVLGAKSTGGSRILRNRSRNWRFDIIEISLPDLKAAARGAEASLNDVFLAGLIGGFRRYHDEMGVQFEKMPIAFPISIRKADDPAGGNFFAGAQYAAPIAERDPVKRVAHVREFVRCARAEPALDVVPRLSPLLVRLPGAALGMLSAHMIGLQDAQISNVQGWKEPVYIGGAEVLHFWPFGPAPGCAIMIVMLSYNGCCSIGITSDVAAVTEPELLVACLREGLEEILALAKPPAAAPTAPPAPPARRKPASPGIRRPRKRRTPHDAEHLTS